MYILKNKIPVSGSCHIIQKILTSTAFQRCFLTNFREFNNYCFITFTEVVMWKAITCECKIVHPTEAITTCRHYSCWAHTPPANQSNGNQQRLDWRAAILCKRSCVWCLCRGWPSTWPALPDSDCLIQLLQSSRSTAPGRSLSAPLHTLMELHVIYPPYANLSLSPTRRLWHRIITLPSFPASLSLPPPSPRPPRLLADLSFAPSLCRKKHAHLL